MTTWGNKTVDGADNESANDIVASTIEVGTLTATGTTNSTLPSGTHTLAPVDSPTLTTPTLGVATATSLDATVFGTWALGGTNATSITLGRANLGYGFTVG